MRPTERPADARPRDDSNIPRLGATHVQRLRTINQNIKRKRRVSDEVEHLWRAEQLLSAAKKEFSSQLSKHKQLFVQVQEAMRKVRFARHDFETEEQATLSVVGRYENEISVKLEELSRALDSRYNEQKFALENEYLGLEEFDAEAQKRIQELGEERAKLTEMLREVEKSHSDEAKAEAAKMEAEYEAERGNSSLEAKQVLQSRTRDFESLTQEEGSLLIEIESKRTKLAEVNDRVNHLESIGTNYEAMKRELQLEEKELDSQVNDLEKKKLSWDSEKENAELDLRRCSEKISEYESVKRLLQESIQRLESSRKAVHSK